MRRLRQTLLEKGLFLRLFSENFLVLKLEQLADFALMFQQGKIRQISEISAAFSVPRCLCGLVLCRQRSGWLCSMAVAMCRFGGERGKSP